MNSLIFSLFLSLGGLYFNTSVGTENNDKQIMLYREANQYSHLTLKDICNVIFKKNFYIQLDRYFNKSIDQMPLQDKHNSSNRGISLDFMAFDQNLKLHGSYFRKKINNKLNHEEIAETLLGEASFTKATDKKPIVATYGCGPCVPLGGYETVNKIAFIVNFSNVGEVRWFGGTIFYNIAKLAKEKITTPIQLHLRGGSKGLSEPIIKAIKLWMDQREDLPMEMVSEDILDDGMSFSGKSLSIDSRNGMTSEYDPKSNSKARGLSDLDVKFFLTSAIMPNIRIAYTPSDL